MSVSNSTKSYKQLKSHLRNTSDATVAISPLFEELDLKAAKPGSEDREAEGTKTENRGGQAALEDSILWFNKQLDRSIDDHTDAGEHPDRPTTAREYWEDVRRFDPETVADKLLGWAPPDARVELLRHLRECGHDRDAIRATGLFTEDLRPLWQGRYVIPYFDVEGRVAYAISRSTGEEGGGAKGYDGHPEDFIAGKYGKLAHTKEYVSVDEPIYGLDSLESGEDVIITEGILDAIKAQEAGYACLSPVTTRFKHRHREALLNIFEERNLGTVYVVQDAERPTSDLDEGAKSWDALTVKQFGEGVKGGATTVGFLAENGVDARLAELPRPGLDKVDLDDYLNRWADTLDPILASAVPPEQHPAYNPQQSDETKARAVKRARHQTEPTGKHNLDGDSALFDLDLIDVVPVSEGYRGPSPLGHHGESENYYVVLDDGEVGYDHKHKAAYNALTHLLCEIGERRDSAPEGSLSDAELLAVWIEAKRQRHLASDDPIPHAALRHFAVDRGLCDRDDLRDGWRIPREAYNAALEAIRSNYDLNPGREPVGRGGYASHSEIEDCPPPMIERERVDVAARRDKLAGERYDEYIDADGPVVWEDAPGTGKTTTSGLAAAERERPHSILFDKHRKAREYQVDDVTPDNYVHLKGGDQKLHDECMDADHAGIDCPNHGHPSNCPHMCPIYDLDREHPIRQLYDQLVNEVGSVKAHLILANILEDEGGIPGHDEDGQCPWIEQFNEAARADRLVGVHEYQPLKTVKQVRDGPARDVIIDESVDPQSVAREREFDVESLVRASNALEEVADVQPQDSPERYNLERLAAFARAVVNELTSNGEADLTTLSAPEIVATAYKTYNDVAGHHVTREEATKSWRATEALARAKIAYNESIISRMRRDEWEGAPLVVNALLAAAIPAGFDTDIARRAIAVPETLDSCPRCGSDLVGRGGRRVCHNDGGCGWDETDDALVGRDTDPARAGGWLDSDSQAGDPQLTYRRLPDVADLPDQPLLLDATASRDKIAGLYGVPVNDVVVTGDECVDLPELHVTQILDGQYHYSTLKQSDTARERTERTVNKLDNLHGEVLVVARKDLLKILDLPEDVTTLHYHATRGLNFEDHDAVVAIGGPHPNVKGVRRDAELLAQGHDDLRIGGAEHSTRNDVPNPPVYRKLDYTDAQGRGRGIPTKHYTGLVGELFREKRERELEQDVHRIRPLLADDTKHAYLLTNVPTNLPIDEVSTFEELADPPRSLLPVAEGALDLAEAIHDVATGELSVDGFRTETFADRLFEYDSETGEVRINKAEATGLAAVAGVTTADGTTPSYETVCRWMNGLDDIGLLNEGEYEQRKGVRFSTDESTLSRALSIISSNTGVKVAAVRRFRAIVEAADGSLGWLEWARKALGLTGDRCEWINGGDSPTHDLR